MIESRSGIVSRAWRDHHISADRLGWIAAGGAVAALGYRAAQRRFRLHGRVALITGGSRGLGLLIARELADHGCRLVLCARDDRELEGARAELAARGAAVLAVVCDVSREDQVQAMVEQAVQRFGRIDILINNASIMQVGPLHTMTSADFREAMDNNFFGLVHTCLAVVPQMRARREGRIVNIASIGGQVAVPHLLPYDCAKFATTGLSEGLAAELARDGVRVTTVVPGLMRTGSQVNAFFKGRQEQEFAWFVLGSATPLTSVSARRAARRIVRSLRHGELFVTISWPARVLRIAHDLFPSATIRLMAVINRVLPSRDGGTRESVRGMRLTHPLAPSFATRLVSRAALRNREYGGWPRPSPSHARRIGLI